MKHFTSESISGQMKPSERTLDIIRQVAYTYRSNTHGTYCLN